MTGKTDKPAKDPAKAFQQRLRSRMREGWQLVGRSDNPPKARLRRRADTQKGPRRDPDNLMFQHVHREIWIDEEGVLKDEEVAEQG